MEGIRRMEYEHVIHPFEPVYSRTSQILILGSFPSVKSREQSFYYGHPQNRFWKVISGLLRETVPVTVEEKREMLLKHDIASCDIVGSSDISIKNATPTDVATLVKRTQICKIFCNGKKAGKLYEKYQQKDVEIPAITLPSTSPANAAFSVERLIAEWGRYLDVR